MKRPKLCPVCGNSDFSYVEVLWPELIKEWELNVLEKDYINRQQGLSCTQCKNNLRTMALAFAILKRYSFEGNLNEFVLSESSSLLKVLEINSAGQLTPILSQLDGHTLIEYPEFNMTNIALDSGSFDLVLHSDTLEHVPDIVKGLSECKRVLRNKGACIYTVPVIVERLTRSRDQLDLSYHGSNLIKAPDQIVYTEFGADVWQWPILAGFRSTTIHSFEFPAALAIEAINE